MKWGELSGNSEDLLYWILWFAIGAFSEGDLEGLLQRMFIRCEGLSGDPGWEFEYEPDACSGHYVFSADQNMSGIFPSSRVYSVQVVKEAMKESMLALVNKYPERAGDLQKLICKYEL
ncbi:hypothetical protein FBY10_104337 [Pseudomonas sp. SJZ103]|uniref:hypothetical protein n=1 Tax=unclassified Pseudomonas TaxID=196821 RepID=UPI0011A1E4E9|nr:MULTISPECIES: hypothetical protein [unclassified Pseudomonas]TWC70935.1 hypothetical protein FBY10_104337 [Pseudomonas sp. SJZ103]TWC88474.1 hypothetical protein FBY08_103337 [Pseudomonas sp. SJZ094]